MKTFSSLLLAGAALSLCLSQEASAALGPSNARTGVYQFLLKRGETITLTRSGDISLQGECRSNDECQECDGGGNTEIRILASSKQPGSYAGGENSYPGGGDYLPESPGNDDLRVLFSMSSDTDTVAPPKGNTAFVYTPGGQFVKIDNVVLGVNIPGNFQCLIIMDIDAGRLTSGFNPKSKQ